MNDVMVTLYERESGKVLYSTKLNLPPGANLDEVTQADWEAAAEQVRQASGKEVMFGVPGGDKVVRNGVFVDRIKPMDERRDRAWQAIKRERGAREVAGFPFMGKTIQNDPESALKIANRAARARDALTAAEEFTTTWTTADNSDLVLDANQTLDLFAAMDDYADGIHETAQRLRAEIANAVTAEEVAAVRWPEATAAN